MTYSLMKEINSHFDYIDRLFGANSQRQEPFPKYNAYLDEADDALVLEFALAGFAKDELSVDVENAQLTVKGHKGEKEAENKRYAHRGIAKRNFQVTYAVPKDYCEEDPAAEFENGILTVRLKGKAQVETRRVVAIQ